MKPDVIIESITKSYSGIMPKSSWGETSLFYNPGEKLPNGVYFCTIKEQDGDNDKASKLERADVFRLSLGVSKKTYESYFGERPSRPTKGEIVDTGHDFSKIDELMPHPIYAWMSWVCVLSPSQQVFDDISPLIAEAYTLAVTKFEKRIKSN